ncbi:MAG: U32 family peptidase, partial [Muribaculaceae bacterium]|nr:U32 family peptidase [Muribaculaceae bacterium]
MSRKIAYPRPVELLAPARDAEIAIEAIKHGADAIYMGAGSHGARAAATNSLDDIRRVVEFARPYRVRVYVTVNTIIYDSELEEVERLIRQLYKIGVDAIIVQDTAILEMDLPPIQLHASTQMDTRDADKALWLHAAGFDRVVVARESTIDQIAEIAGAVDTEIEAFVHGALCVSYSGDCRAGWVAQGRSANRGECPQICRRSFSLVDRHNNIIIKDKHLLSLKDLNLSAHVEQLLDAGVTSLKIEGRLKDVGYVKNTVAAYRQILDRIISQRPDEYRRASAGRVAFNFQPALSKGFNRSFTTFFATSAKPAGKMASIDTPKMAGERAGVVVDCRGKCLVVRADVEFNNGDGLGYFGRDGIFDGFRVNRVQGNKLFINKEIQIKRGTVLYRNRDKQHDDLMSGETASRVIGLSMKLRAIPGGICVDLSDDRGCHASVTMEVELQPAKSPQQEARRRVF